MYARTHARQTLVYRGAFVAVAVVVDVSVSVYKTILEVREVGSGPGLFESMVLKR